MDALRPQPEIAAAQAYETLFVPALFGQWAPKVAEAARIGSAQSVLDVACGTGVLSREASARVGPTGRVVGLDASRAMIAVAQHRSPKLEWATARAEALPFANASFDVVVSQFGLMFFADQQTALREMFRVLKPRGRLAVAVWDRLETMPAFAAEVALLERLAGRPAADALRAPFVLGDIQHLNRLFERAGISCPLVVSHLGTAHFPSIGVLIAADLRGWLPIMGVSLPEEQIIQLLKAAEQDLRQFVTDDGAMEFDLSVHIVTATKV